MPRYVAFLRAINVGKRRVAMARLVEIFTELGYKEVTTFLASGNVLFTAGKSEQPRLEKRLSAALEKALGFDVDVFVRTKDEVLDALNRKPFSGIQDSDTIHVTFLHEPLTKAQVEVLERAESAEDAFFISGTEYYWLCRIRVSESKVFSNAEVRRLILPKGTARNLESLGKLASLHFTRET